MTSRHEIKSEKILIKDIFSNLWFRIPEYQRPYIWGRDEIDDLLDDLVFAHDEKPEQEYFLGSFVYQSKKAGSTPGQKFAENDLLDGQQRMTTLLMLLACIRDLSDNYEVKQACSEAVYQKGSSIKRVPERTRIVFAIREAVQEFIDCFVKPAGGTEDVSGLQEAINHSDDRSVRNMASAIMQMRSYLGHAEHKLPLDSFVGFLLNQVLLIYVSTEDLDDAFRLFTILNDRGVPLRNSDILKSQNLGALNDEAEKAKYAKLWEESEGELGEDFDRFLNHIRTILLKDKARLNLLDEFEHKIYQPREKDKATGKIKQSLLAKGKDTFELIEGYLKHYDQLLSGNNYDQVGGSFEFDNLVKVMLIGLPSTDWLPPLMRYFDRFRYERLLDFLIQLDNQLSSDWIAQYTPTKRIERMNDIIRAVEAAQSADDVFTAERGFRFDEEGFNRSAEAAVYGRRFTRYLLLKLDYLYADHSNRMSLETLSVEHVLPQNPKADSQWCKDFTEEQRQLWTHRLGNLVLITTRKNTSQGNLDYADKKTRYFEKRISTCPNSLRVLKNDRWTPTELEANHNAVLANLRGHYGFA
jgi:hypothetical protein